MRLINVKTLRLEVFLDDKTPPYAILSHTWGNDHEELTLRDVEKGNIDKPGTGSVKFQGCCRQAEKDRLEYAWIDTCCIDQTNLVELSEAINSMFRWYRQADVCYAYLSDVPGGDEWRRHGSKFRTSRWFRRGWTLQELLAPKRLLFYDSEWRRLGTKGNMRTAIGEITGVPSQFLLGINDFRFASVAQRMSWAAQRDTKRKEDLAYCLLGIFDVTMPMIYGEGGEQAFLRLQEQIMKKTRDDSILAWGLSIKGLPTSDSDQVTAGRILAAAPSDFANSGHIVSHKRSTALNTFDISGGSLRIHLSLLTTSAGKTIGLLGCGPEHKTQQVVGIPLAKITLESFDQYVRPSGSRSILLPASASSTSPKLIYIKNESQSNKSADTNRHYWLYDEDEFTKLNLDLVDVAPQSCWDEEQALIMSTVESDNGATHRILARLRHNQEGSRDFVILLELKKQATWTGAAECYVMICRRGTTLVELAGNLEYLAHQAFGKRSASNGLLHLRVTLDTDAHPMFIIRSEEAPHPPDVTVDATEELQKSDTIVSIFEDARKGISADEQPSGLTRLANIAVSFLLYIIALLNASANQVVRRVYGLNPELLDHTYQEGLPSGGERLVTDIGKLVKHDPVLEHFFNDNNNFVQGLTQKAADLAGDSGTSLGDKDLLSKVIKVSLHQQVIYCDDSTSMKRQDRWGSQKKLIQRIANITTRILPDGEGVALRFINRDADDSSNLTPEGIAKVIDPMPWQPGGDSHIGTSLKLKVLEPLVYTKIKAKSLERPLLISIMTDGMPEPEPKSTLEDCILECGQMLQDAGYPRESMCLWPNPLFATLSSSGSVIF
ncbi:heterokaryon incompatibility protein het-E-1 [Fusarium mundagurra]|uniref:Heterokaryon incompatibility protein het-E-1 n=1 Tax=Fusarium mundagurra TaxID=1567541 RepID=A0A8H5XVG6_9HYPO|nr:heterokaryon incompatibility protein het-E-1 [Fusarium mundagurra]